MLDNFISPYDATVVERARSDGMVMLGKANMDEFAMGSSNENSYYGPVRNPWDRERVPGGSSGGSAAAVAARLVPVATGTDTGGSVRQPAALCGITGIKPTYGRVSRYGLVAYASSLDQAGVLARSAEDAAFLLAAIAGYDERDSTSVERPLEDYPRILDRDEGALRIGVAKEFFDSGLDPAVGDAIEGALYEFERLGAKRREISIPSLELAIPAYYVVAPAECSSNLSRYDGVRYGYRCGQSRDIESLYKQTRSEGFGTEVKRRILVGTYALSSGYYDAYFLKAQKIRHLISRQLKEALSEVDVIVGPTSPFTAFRIGERIEDPVTMYRCDVNTTAVNLAGLPAVSIPAGFADGLPVGLQLIGDHFTEGRLLQAAHRFQMATDWHERTPAGYE
jgi:aspartyl-tRNA(Asn)/glutamyl-tRNA(Gln) amidotransferase subunit A